MTYGISNDILQPIFFGFGGMVFLALVWLVFIREDRTFDKRYAAYAQRTGLVYTPPARVGRMTIGIETSVLAGQLEGVAVRLVAHYQASSRAAGVNGSTTITGTARAPAHVSFSVTVDGGGKQPGPGRVVTGDARFDALHPCETDHPQAAVLLLDPAVRAALAGRPQGWGASRILYDRGAVSFEVPRFAWEPEHFDYGFRVVVAACSARLA